MGLFSKKSGSRANSVNSDSTGKSGRKGSQTSLASTIRSPTTGQPGRSSSSGNASPPLPAIPSIELPPAPDPALDPSGYLRSIYAVRERSKFVIQAALRNQLTNFIVDMDKFKDVAEYVVSIIKVFLLFMLILSVCLLGVVITFSTQPLIPERREIMPLTIIQFLLMAAGSTLKLAAGLVSIK